MKQETVKLNIGVTREFQKEQGYFDGRFVPRVEKSKKLSDVRYEYEIDFISSIVNPFSS